MLKPPSIFRSEGIADLCTSYGLSDPFRILHPDTRDFTFNPGARRNYRSRLDFFLISDSLIDCLSTCSINLALSTELFDHKAVLLEFNKVAFKPNRSINLTTLNHPRLEETILASTIDCYLNHCTPNQRADLAEGAAEVGRLYAILREINDIEFDSVLSPILGHEIRLRQLNDELVTIKNLLPSPELLNTLVLTCDNDVFLEVLMNNIKNDILNLQSWSKKVSNCKKTTLSRRLTELKGDFQINGEAIAEIELELNRLIDAELTERIKSMKLFECLNSEKPTTMFLSLAKKKNSSKLKKIKDDNGLDFTSEEARNEYIVSFYESLYKKPGDEIISHEGVIENFLGQAILESDLVKNSKLTDQEVAQLEEPLTMLELDKAVKEGNPKSAPGSDGFGMPLIKKCWNVLRFPLYNYILECLRKGKMTRNFRSASIRLIPKKGDDSSIKNWRPISLLSNVYKIFSRVLNSRLCKYTNRICSRAQKGFNKDRFTQEAVFNVWESIAYCNNNKIKAAILAADMEKAFDTISLGYLEEVLKFFRIGPYMRSLLRLAGTDREACIILDNNVLSRSFKLERGRPQGDITSPITFNFCIQILIFKLELDNRIKKIPRLPAPNGREPIRGPEPAPVPVPEPEQQAGLEPDPVPAPTPPNTFFKFESQRETDKNEALADDNTTLVMFDKDSLNTIKEILSDFGLISGLKCNTAKTILMPTFDWSRDDEKLVSDLGFKISDNLVLLGVPITNKLDNTVAIFSQIKGKIENLINFWERFRLTLAGRITILKTCLISQLCYLGSFLPPPPDIIEDIQNLLNNFVKRNLIIARDRLYLPTNEGGLGCFDINTFLQAQTVSWFVRCHKQKIDNWRFDLTESAPDSNLLILRLSDINLQCNPILHNIANCFEKFYEKFTTRNENYKAAFVYKNRAFARNDHDVSTLDDNFFGADFMARHFSKIRNLKLCDFFRNGRMVPMDDLAENGLPVTPAMWLKLQSVGLCAQKKYKKRDVDLQKTENLNTFLNGIKRGSKKIRKILETRELENTYSIQNLCIVRSFYRLTNSDPQPDKIIRLCLSAWDKSTLQNNMREFLFKFT